MAGTVAELWRYPVKSLRGERIDAAELERARSPRRQAVGRHRRRRQARQRQDDGALSPPAWALRPAARGLPPRVTLPDGRELPLGAELDAFLRERYGEDTLTSPRKPP